MNTQLEIAPFVAAASESPAPTINEPETVSLLREILEVQREHLASIRAAQDAGSRWRAFVARWRQDFPDLADACRNVLPILERTYGALIADLAEHLQQQGHDALENDFSLQEFLDRYGMRLAQLGTILNMVVPLAEACSEGESSAQ